MDQINRFKLQVLYNANIGSPPILHKISKISLSTTDRNLRRFQHDISSKRISIRKTQKLNYHPNLPRCLKY